MALESVKVYGIEFDVYYDCNTERDPYGTGDSPTSHDIDIISIEAGADTQDLQDVLANSVIEKIIEQIIEIESE